MGRLSGLDALRGVAALMVFVHHFNAWFHLGMVTTGFMFGVDLFFVLSGFVMARTYELRLRGGVLSLGGFLSIRYSRLWFPLALGSMIGFAAVAIMYGISADLLLSFATILVFLPAPWSRFGVFGLNNPAWSLFVEIICNVAHALALSRLSEKALIVICGLASLAFLVPTYMGGYVVWGETWQSTLMSVPRGLAGYIAGVLVFRRYGDSPLGSSPVLTITALPALMWVSSWLPAFVTGAAMIAIVGPLAVRMSLGLPSSKGARWLGMISYPLYATHAPLFTALLALGPFYAGAIALTLAISVAWFYEGRRHGSSRPSVPLTA